MQKNNLWLRSFQSRNKQMIHVRPIQAGDLDHFIDIFEHMGAESRYQRFNQTQNHLSPQKIKTEAQRMVDISLDGGAGLIAFTDRPVQKEIPVAVARYVLIDAQTAEIAMSVRDDMHGQGIGTTLFNLLLAEAEQAGIQKIVGMLQNNNTGMWVLFDRIPYPVTRILDGTISDIEIDLTKTKKT